MRYFANWTNGIFTSTCRQHVRVETSYGYFVLDCMRPKDIFLLHKQVVVFFLWVQWAVLNETRRRTLRTNGTQSRDCGQNVCLKQQPSNRLLIQYRHQHNSDSVITTIPHRQVKACGGHKAGMKGGISDEDCHTLGSRRARASWETKIVNKIVHLDEMSSTGTDRLYVWPFVLCPSFDVWFIIALWIVCLPLCPLTFFSLLLFLF